VDLEQLWKWIASGGGGCPALYTTDGGYVVQGKKLDADARAQLRDVAVDEDAVFVPADVLDRLRQPQPGRSLTDEEFAAELSGFERTAFRLELQRAYAEPEEEATVACFQSGSPEPPTEVPALRGWYEQTAQLIAEGRAMARVRVHEDPPTAYQRWERWAGQWNIAAGEEIRYLTRNRAHEVGLLPAAGEADWWLLDSQRLILMRFDDQHHRVSTELVTDPVAVAQACAWRDLAAHYAVLEPVQDVISAA
jgi:hypothetical protein